MPEIKKYRIVSIESPISGIKIFRLEPLEGFMKYDAGHFAFMHILDDKGRTVVKRPYSIASAPSAPYLEFCIKMVGGELTGRLDNMKKGEIVGIEGPFGHFTLEGERKAAFIAGGTGITPFMSILRDIAERKLRGEFVLFYSARTRDSIIYKDGLEEVQKRNPNIKVVITLTREEPEGWNGECGRINDEMVCRYSKPEEFSWWICGPMAMIKTLKECLVKRGADPKRLKLEGWG